MRKVLYLMGIMNDGDIDWIGRAGEVQSFQPGAVLIRQGVPTEWLHLVLEGHLQVLLDDTIEVARLGQGEVLGEISFLDSRAPSASVVALDQAYVLALHRDVIAAKLASDLGFASRFYHSIGAFLADRLRATSSQFGYLPKEAHHSFSVSENPADELDDTWTEQVSFAASRFDHLLKTLQIA